MKLRTIFSALFALAAAAALVQAAPLKEARVTQVINDVRILPGQAEAKPAVVNDEVREGTAVRTGIESRSELTFADLSIARLGANTIFSFDQGQRSVELGGGAILLRVPKDSGGARIKTAAVTAAITGTTVMAEYNCEDTRQNRIQSRCPDADFKFIVLEGSMRVCKTGGARECVDLGPGQMLAGSIDEPLGEPIDIDLARLLDTSLLIRGFPPIGSEDLIAANVRAQDRGLPDIGYVSTNNTFVNLIDAQDQRAAALPTQSPTPSPSPTATPTPTPTPTASPSPSPSPTPQPTPQKFGTPPVITSSVPYTITSGTAIETDPTITTNGVTDEGRIYRDVANDGTPSSYFFTTASAFDISNPDLRLPSFDQQFATGGPIATFKFAALRLAGNPMISTSNNGPVRLALISVGDMTSAAPGGALTFAGIEQLLLATQNGSISFGSNIEFRNLPALYIYARGAGSTLTIDSAITGTRDLFLLSEGILRSTGSLAVNQTSLGQSTGLNISLRAGGMINIGGNLDLRTTAGNIQNGANISVISGGDTTIGGVFTLRQSAASNTTTGIGGDIIVRTGGSLTAGSLNFSSAFGSSREVTDGADTQLIIGGNLATTAGGITVSHATPVGGSPRRLVRGGNLTLNVNGNLTTSSGSAILIDLINTSGSTVQNGANIIARVGGNLTTGAVTLRSSNSSNGATERGSNATLNVGGNVNFSTLTGSLINTFNGNIGTGGNFLFIGRGNATGSTMSVTLDNRDGGAIGTGGNLTLDLMQNLTLTGGVTFLVNNGGAAATNAGSIGTGGNILLEVDGATNAQAIMATVTNTNGAFIGTGGNVSVNAGSITVAAGNTLALLVANAGGSIGTGGNVLANIANAFSGGVSMAVTNNGGSIGTGGDVRLLTFGPMTADPQRGIDLRVSNINGGSIGTGGNVSANLGGAFKGIFAVSNGGTAATNAGSIGTGGNILITLDRDTNAQSISATVTNTTGGSIGVGGTISFVAAGFVGPISVAVNSLGLVVANNGGSIGTGGTVFADILEGFSGDVNMRVSNNGGSINTGGNVTLEIGGNVTADSEGGLNLRVSNNAGSIGTGGNVSAFLGANFTGGTINARVQNNSNGSIMNGGNVRVEITGALTTDPDEGGFTLRVANNSGGQIGTGGNVFGIIGGNLTATVVDLAVDNDAGGNINAGGNIDLSVGGNLTTDVFTLRIGNVGGHIGNGGNMTATIGGDLRASSIDATIDSRSGGAIDQGGLINLRVNGSLITTEPPDLFIPGGTEPIGDANFQIFLTPSDDEVPHGGITGPAILVRANGGISIGGSLNAFIDDSGGIGAPSGGVGLVQISTAGAIDVLNRLNVLGIVVATGAINAGVIAGTDVNSSVSINAGFGGIRQFELPSNGARTDLMHFLSAARVTSQNGIDFNGYSAVGDATPATNGGRLTINATSMTFGGDNADVFGGVTLNGGDSSTVFGPGGGGELVVNTSGQLTVFTDIEATSGFVDSNLPPSGRGGAVTLDSSSGLVDIDSRIEVSSRDPAPTGTPNPTPPRRRSTQGGNITVRSGRVGNTPGPTGNQRTVAVSISNSSQLLALLDAVPTAGPGGKITILATGANTDVNVNGRLEATKGTIDIRHEAAGGRVNIGSASSPTARTNMSADVIKARAFGANGQLNIGNTNMSADNLIRLYAPGSNGQLNFVANTTLSANNRIDLAAGTLTIQPNVIVTITGNAGPANVYTSNANYSGFGGSNPANGTFGGNGANTPQPLGNAPPFDGASQPGGQ
jgi:hypothetical protein